MIHEYLYMLIPYFSLGMLGLAIQFKVYKRSVSAFMSLINIAITSNLFYYGYIELGIVVVAVYMSIVMVRAICKRDNDKWFPSPSKYCSEMTCLRRKLDD